MTTLKKKSEAAALVASLRDAYNSGLTAKRQWRINQLNALRQMVVDNESVLEAALFSDLGKSASEAQLTEIGIILGDIDYALKNLSGWLKPQKVSVPLAVMPAKAFVVSEPVGVALIIAPWNYPMQIFGRSVGGALAAGNACVVKPAEDACLSLIRVAQLAAEVGFPAGALNIVTQAPQQLATQFEAAVLALAPSGARSFHELSVVANPHVLAERLLLAIGEKRTVLS